MPKRPRKMRGFKIAGFWLDEAARLPARAPVHSDEAHRAITERLTLCVLGKANHPELAVQETTR